jgi:hypothetical protein
MSSILSILRATSILIVTGCAIAAASSVDTVERMGTGPCRNDAHTSVLLNALREKLVTYEGFAGADIQIVTDSATCAAGLAAYNVGAPPELVLTEAHFIRRGTQGFVLVPPGDLDSQWYYSSTWAFEAIRQGL